jgi:hypothetical protein
MATSGWHQQLSGKFLVISESEKFINATESTDLYCITDLKYNIVSGGTVPQHWYSTVPPYIS